MPFMGIPLGAFGEGFGFGADLIALRLIMVVISFALVLGQKLVAKGACGGTPYQVLVYNCLQCCRYFAGAL